MKCNYCGKEVDQEKAWIMGSDAYCDYACYRAMSREVSKLATTAPSWADPVRDTDEIRGGRS